MEWKLELLAKMSGRPGPTMARDGSYWREGAIWLCEMRSRFQWKYRVTIVENREGRMSYPLGFKWRFGGDLDELLEGIISYDSKIKINDRRVERVSE